MRQNNALKKRINGGLFFDSGAVNLYDSPKFETHFGYSA